ncbi:MAG TPA: hypothetical protein VHT92_12970 [Candidatus Cybelea sp.]|nr:hypothetical protein [Candidatus Cybelea sp.]
MSYESESRTLDAEILGLVEAWHRRGESPSDASFNDLALRLFAYQLRYNGPYARYCARLGVTCAPASWESIPAVPAPAFAEAALATFDPRSAAAVFETSGTTRGTPGRHYLETTQLYDAALLAGFERLIVNRGARLRYLNLVPNPSERPHSSLGYMMAAVSDRLGDGRTAWYLRGDVLLAEEFERDLRAAISAGAPVCIAATSFALVHLLDALHERNVRFELPPGSRIMGTGGFKGRARVVEREELERGLRDAFGLPEGAIFSEYGMTELCSQYYDASGTGDYVGPPWLRTRVVGPDRKTLPRGEIGSLLHVDLANRSSCIAIQTEDLGMQSDDGLVLLGRDREAALRGCSLDAESLTARR